MGWLVSVVIIIMMVVSDMKIDGNAALIASALFAIAGALGSIAASVRK